MSLELVGVTHKSLIKIALDTTHQNTNWLCWKGGCRRSEQHLPVFVPSLYPLELTKNIPKGYTGCPKGSRPPSCLRIQNLQKKKKKDLEMADLPREKAILRWKWDSQLSIRQNDRWIDSRIYKAWLVVKDFTKTNGIDYHVNFEVIKLNTIFQN